MLLDSFWIKLLHEKQHFLANLEELMEEKERWFSVSDPVVCPVKSSGYVSKAMEPSVGGGALARIRLTSTFRPESRDRESPERNKPATKRNMVGRKSCRRRKRCQR